MNNKYIDKYIIIDGMNVRYWDEGEGECIILIHGVGGSIETWSSNIGELSKSFRVIAFDIPGNGKSSRPTNDVDYSLDYAGKFSIKLIKQLGVNQFNVAGNSMGGIFALQIAYMYSHAVNKLILIDSVGLDKDISFLYRLFSIKPIGELLIRPNKLNVRLLSKFLIFNDNLVTEEFVNMMVEMSRIPGTTHSFLKMVRTGVNMRGVFVAFTKEKFEHLTMPVLIIWGKQDLALPFNQTRLALKYINNCRAVVLNRAGHVAQMDRPKACNQLISEFVRDGKTFLEYPPNPDNIYYL